MKVTFVQADENLASARLRNLIPLRELKKLGWQEGHDVIVLSKHNWSWDERIRQAFQRVVFDICDDWFDTEEWGAHYRLVSQKADLMTCNSAAMAERIREVTGRDAVVIDDPWEDPQVLPNLGEGVLWFGNKANLQDLVDALPQISYPLTVISDHPAKGITPWSLETQKQALWACRAVVIPTGPRKCKSANRAVTAIRAGKMAICGDLPAYREIPGLWVGDLREGLDWVMNEDPSDRVREAQAYVHERFHPKRIGRQWHEALKGVL